MQILNDNETRGDYDYALAHPRQHMLNQYRYYRNRCKFHLITLLCSARSCAIVKGYMSLTKCAVLCRVYRQMKVPWQITLTGVVLLCSVIHYITKQQMYENVRTHACATTRWQVKRAVQQADGKGLFAAEHAMRHGGRQ